MTSSGRTASTPEQEASDAFGRGDNATAQRLYRSLLVTGPTSTGEAFYNLGVVARRLGFHGEAVRLITRALRLHGADRPPPRRSVIVPVLDFSPHSPFNIRTLLDDLKGFDGEVVCVFNDPAVARALDRHPRIDKRAINSANAGVGRAWNIGINLAEGATIFVLNADLKVTPETLDTLERHLLSLPDAVAVGVSGDRIDWQTLKTKTFIDQSATLPTNVDMVSGFLFALHADRFHGAGLTFDPRLGPCFYEEMDLALKAHERGLKLYVVPTTGWQHRWGVSRNATPIVYFGRETDRALILARNAMIIKIRRDALLTK